MIKNFEPQPYDGLNPLPSYVTNVSSFTLTGSVPGGYEITLAKLTVGESVSAGNPLSHALFETILYALGEFFQAQNPEIAEVAVVSQSCH